MAIYDILCQKKDCRKQQEGVCDFNGYLEDYVANLDRDDEAHDVLSALSAIDPSLKVIVGLGLNINKEAIANQIIHYKDSFKLPDGMIRCPYIIYGKSDDEQRAIIVTLGDRAQYIIAKALYFVMSEPDNKYEGTRNEMIAFAANEEHLETLIESTRAFFMEHKKAGSLQRRLDMLMFESYDEMYEEAKRFADEQSEQMGELLAQAEDKALCINQLIVKWFLMKKFSYVQYMMDKNNLNVIHGGNVKRQRQVAKEKADNISFVSFTQLWKIIRQNAWR